MIANPQHFSWIARSLKDSESSDVVCPFLRVLNVKGQSRKDFIASGDYQLFEPYLETELPGDMKLLYYNTAGAITFFRRSEYMRVGGYDPRFLGWGGEDDDLLIRATRLGVRWHSLQGDRAALFHLHHDSTSRDEALAASERNRAAAAETRELPQADLEARAAELARYFD